MNSQSDDVRSFIKRGMEAQKAVDEAIDQVSKPGNMVSRTDRVELEGGVAHLPAEFRMVARLANQAGLEGWKFVDLEYGPDLDTVRDRLQQAAGAPDLKDVGSCVKITYVEDLDRKEIVGFRADQMGLGFHGEEKLP